jgi:PadR family transcriptional regulator PadR
MSAREIGVLSRMEEFLLLAVWGLGEGAYGVPIRRRLQRELRRKLSVGAVYVPLERLVARGLRRAATGAPTPVRGGRRKRFYRLTPEGLRALRETRRITQRLWAGTRELERSRL